MRVITVCTGNICRSPIAEQALRARLADFEPVIRGALTFASAGTIAQPGQAMPDEAADWSRKLGGDPSAHGATFLTEAVLKDATLVLAMSREHRTKVLSLAPALMRRTFTIREFARLLSTVPEGELLAALDGPLVDNTPEARLGALLGALADGRGLVAAGSAGDDDVVDPYRQADSVFALASEQMLPGIDAVHRLLASSVVWQDK